MPTLPVSVARVHGPEGAIDYVTLTPPDSLAARGLDPATILGRLHTPVQPDHPITPAAFEPNAAFAELLQAVISRDGPDQPGLCDEARRIGEGRVYVIDRRTPTPEGPVPPEDIFGVFAVRDGTVVTGSYRPSPSHRLLSDHGFFRLDEGLEACLLRELAARSTV
ncbi:MAG: hypothetical protein ACRENB_08195 [Gemmatimonadales bacterium]